MMNNNSESMLGYYLHYSELSNFVMNNDKAIDESTKIFATVIHLLVDLFYPVFVHIMNKFINGYRSEGFSSFNELSDKQFKSIVKTKYSSKASKDIIEKAFLKFPGYDYKLPKFILEYIKSSYSDILINFTKQNIDSEETFP